MPAERIDRIPSGDELGIEERPRLPKRDGSKKIEQTILPLEGVVVIEERTAKKPSPP